MSIEIKAPLSVTDHRRDIAGMRYVYPVVSRRAGGVSIGINLNPNNACNWACVYCQVPDLQRGPAPAIDLGMLEAELTALLDEVVHGDFMQSAVPAEARRLNDIAFSGNGEPTTAAEFLSVMELVAKVRAQFALDIKTVLITNGSQLDKAAVQAGIARMGQLQGEVWFKLDRAPEDGFAFVNQINLRASQVERRLRAAAALCPTWIQTCMFALDGQLPSEVELAAYLAFLQRQLAAGVPLAGVLLYGLARPSLQPAAPRLSAAPADWMQDLATRIEALGLPVKLSA
ncbi:radical SAM protein [Chitinibacter tainanensis]|uniref:radical SAM protein n=1 Tax=Chitinibacter tainanensis TaxID=230667 RepID=UPI00041603A0|nr:radical SAM protein [Chitinibacter tainanensis]